MVNDKSGLFIYWILNNKSNRQCPFTYRLFLGNIFCILIFTAIPKCVPLKYLMYCLNCLLYSLHDYFCTLAK